MTIGFDVRDSGVLYNMLADLGGDIVVKTDAAGFIEHTSEGFSALGFAVEDMLIAPHIADLTDSLHADLLRCYCDQTLSGGHIPERIEVPLWQLDGSKQWYSISLRPLPGPSGSGDRAAGAIAVMRCVEQNRSLQTQLFESVMTDPLTGIANRQSFMGRVNRLMANGQRGSIALFEIDGFRAIRLRFGQKAGDSVAEAFARFLQTMLDHDHILARLEDNRFGVMLPQLSQKEAIDYATETVATFTEISRDAELEEMRLTASASVCTLGKSLDETLKRAEVALTVARSAGGYRVECGDELRQSWRSRKSA